MKNKIVSLKETKIVVKKPVLKEQVNVQDIIQSYRPKILGAAKQGDHVTLDRLQGKLKGVLQSVGYNWKQDPLAIELIGEELLESMKKKAKIKLLTKKLEEAVGRKVVLIEAVEGKIKKIDKFGHERTGFVVNGFLILPSKYFGHKPNLKFKDSKYVIYNGAYIESYEKNLQDAITKCKNLK